MSDSAPTSPALSPVPVSLGEAFRTWCRVAALSFGGPAGQIAVMHRIIVDEKKWISEDRFLHALNYCMLIPGPEAQQLAVYIGWLMHRTLGGLVAGILFVLPGFLSILALSIVYAFWNDADFVQALFWGLKPAVLAIVLEAVLRIGKRVLKNNLMRLLAGVSFLCIFCLGVPFPVLILAAGLIGLAGGRWAPRLFQVLKGHSAAADATPPASEAVHPDLPAPSWVRSLKISAVCLSLWFGPLLVLWAALGPDSIFLQQGVFFSQCAMVTFGGAYSVLAYVAQQAVENLRWLQPGEMLDGLGMAETTPGPLIMVVQFVAFLGAYRNPGSLSPLAAGILGSCVTTWVTFVPCFYWIFLGASSVERLRGNRHVSSALSAITASVVGVVLNLAVWFAIHTLFQQVVPVAAGPIQMERPVWSTFHWPTGLIALLACLLTFWAKRGMATTLAICGVLGLLFWKVAN